MKLSNKKVRGRFYLFAGFLGAALLMGLAIYFSQLYLKNDDDAASLAVALPLFLLFLFYVAGRQIFEYDSDGEVLHIQNRNLIFLWEKQRNDEFPKYKLRSYDVVSLLFYKRLYLKVSSRKNTLLTLKYDISYLKKEELQALKFSLSKTIAQHAGTDNKN